MKLTKQQIDYAFERIDDAVRAKITKKVGEKPTVKVPSWTEKQMKDAIYSGDASRAVLKPRGEAAYGYVTTHFSYPELEKAQAAARKPLKEWETKHAAAEKAEKKKAQKVKDQIMLSGDAAAALALLDRYAASEE